MNILKTKYIVLALLLLTQVTVMAAADSQKRYNYFFMEAMMEREKGNSTAAFELLRHCIRINPEASEAYYFMGQYYAAMKDKQSMLAYFKKATELNPQNTFYLETLAQAYIESNLNDKAIATLEKLITADSDRADILELLGQLYQQNDDYDNTIKTLDRLERLEGKSERLSYAKSSIYTQQGNKKAAINEMKQLATQYPNDLNYKGMYGDVLLMNGEADKAYNIYKDILKEEPDNNHALLSMRTYYEQENKRAEADSMTVRILLNKNTSNEARIAIMRQEINESEEAGGDSTRVLHLFRQLMTLPLTNGDLPFLYVTYMELKKMPEDSIKPVLDRVLSVSPDNAAARLRLVLYAWFSKHLDEVIRLCDTARQYNPDNIAFYYFEGMAYFGQKKTAQALEVFTKGVKAANPKSNTSLMADTYSFIAEIYVKEKRIEEAFSAYDSCLQWRPDDPFTLNNYAYFLSLTGKQLDKAEQMSQKAIKAEPNNANSLDTYAWILFLQKRYAEAKIYIEQALKNDTDSSATIYEHAGDIYAQTGNTDKAVELWKQAEKADPGNKILARKIKQRRYIKEK